MNEKEKEIINDIFKGITLREFNIINKYFKKMKDIEKKHNILDGKKMDLIENE